MMTISVLIVVFASGDSPYFCPILFIFLLYQDPFLSSLERQAMLYLLLQRSRFERHLQMLAVVYALRKAVEEVGYCYQSPLGLGVEYFLKFVILKYLLIMKYSDVVVEYIC